MKQHRSADAKAAVPSWYTECLGTLLLIAPVQMHPSPARLEVSERRQQRVPAVGQVQQERLVGPDDSSSLAKLPSVFSADL